MKMSLRIKVFALVCSLVISSVTVLFILLRNSFSEHRHSDFKQRAFIVADYFARNSVEGIIIEDEDGLSGTLETLFEIEDIVFAAIYDSEGTEIVSRSNVRVDGDFAWRGVNRLEEGAADRIIAASGMRVLDFTIPVSIGEHERVGWVRVGVGLQRLDSELRRMTVHSLMLLALFAAVALVMSFLVANSIAHPINEVAGAIRAFGEGDLDCAVATTRSDELGQLATGFNRMAENLKLRTEALRLQSEITAHLSEGISLVRVSDGVVIYTNRGFDDLFGYASGELNGKHANVLNAPTDRTPEETAREIGERVKKAGVWRGEVQNIKKDGTRFWCHASVSVYAHPEHGDVYISVQKDITERKRLEEQLRQSEKMEAIGQLAGGVAHDFNNQLGGIMNYADLLLAKTEDEELRRYIEAIIRSCTRGKDLTGQLLAFSRKGKYQVVPVNIHQTIAEVVSMLGRSSDRRIGIRQHLDALRSTTTGDPTQLHNVLLNLGLNARDAMPEGGDLVFATDTLPLTKEHCRKSPFDITPGDYLKITVTDSGTGMDEETRAHVFEPFFTTKEEGKGTGMGLASIYGTVVNHHGAVELDSEFGKGTSVTVYLPLSPREAWEAAGVAHVTVAKDGGARILLVDDEKGVRESTAQLLCDRGYAVVSAGDGAEAVEYYGKSWQQTDLVIVDMNMPVMNGRDTFAAMRKINPDVKAMLATGYSLDDRAQEILDEGALSHIQKPFRIHDLINQIEQALGG